MIWVEAMFSSDPLLIQCGQTRFIHFFLKVYAPNSCPVHRQSLVFHHRFFPWSALKTTLYMLWKCTFNHQYFISSVIILVRPEKDSFYYENNNWRCYPVIHVAYLHPSSHNFKGLFYVVSLRNYIIHGLTILVYTVLFYLR